MSGRDFTFWFRAPILLRSLVYSAGGFVIHGCFEHVVDSHRGGGGGGGGGGGDDDGDGDDDDDDDDGGFCL